LLRFPVAVTCVWFEFACGQVVVVVQDVHCVDPQYLALLVTTRYLTCCAGGSTIAIAWVSLSLCSVVDGVVMLVSLYWVCVLVFVVVVAVVVFVVVVDVVFADDLRVASATLWNESHHCYIAKVYV
jgi:hypothetical protein